MKQPEVFGFSVTQSSIYWLRLTLPLCQECYWSVHMHSVFFVVAVHISERITALNRVAE